MASSTCLVCSSKVVPARDLSSASSSAFAPSPVSTSPQMGSKPAPRLAAARCAMSDEEQAPAFIGRRMLAGVVATGAALAVFTNMAVAAQGPGQEGARRVAEKADKILKAADKLNIEEAPQRFGPGRSGGAEDPTKISQIAGSGLTDSSKKGLKKGVTDATEGVREATQKVKGNSGGGFFGFGKKAESAADNATNAAANVQRKITRDGLGRIRGADSDLENAASNTVGEAKSKANVGSSGGNVLNSLQEGLQGIRESVVQSTSDVKSTVDKSLQ